MMQAKEKAANIISDQRVRGNVVPSSECLSFVFTERGRDCLSEVASGTEGSLAQENAFHSFWNVIRRMFGSLSMKLPLILSGTMGT